MTKPRKGTGMSSVTTPKIEQLQSEERKAFAEFTKLVEPANKARRIWEAARDAAKAAVLYETIRRRVLRDLLNSASSEEIGKEQP